MSDDDWWYGCVGYRSGWFPASFVRVSVECGGNICSQWAPCIHTLEDSTCFVSERCNACHTASGVTVCRSLELSVRACMCALVRHCSPGTAQIAKCTISTACGICLSTPLPTPSPSPHPILQLRVGLVAEENGTVEEGKEAVKEPSQPPPPEEVLKTSDMDNTGLLVLPDDMVKGPGY